METIAALGMGLGLAAACGLRVFVPLLIVGIALFSGSLYGYALTGTRALAMITPLGGVCFIAGWVALGVGAWRRGPEG